MTPQEFGEAFDTSRRQATVRYFTREQRGYGWRTGFGELGDEHLDGQPGLWAVRARKKDSPMQMKCSLSHYFSRPVLSDGYK